MEELKKWLEEEIRLKEETLRMENLSASKEFYDTLNAKIKTLQMVYDKVEELEKR